MVENRVVQPAALRQCNTNVDFDNRRGYDFLRIGRCLIAHEATGFSGFGAELSATVQEQCFWDLEAPIQRVAGWDTPYPHAFEWEYFPGPQRVAIGLKALMEAA